METLGIVLTFAWMAIALALALLLGTWIYLDARRRGSNSPVLVALGAACLLLPAAIYFLRRDRIGPRGPMHRGERLVGTAFLGCLFGALGGILAPPDPATGGAYGLAFVPVGLVAGYVLVWRGGWTDLRDQLAP